MKYIRTKDGRILKVFCENVPLFQENDGLTYYGKNTIDFETSCWFPKDEIAKQADTIEELCDEFVGIDSQGHYIIHNDKFIEGARIIPLEKVNYYGAIWTNKGLIYIAKMNEEGELELL